ncbi:MAG: M16 family metallopeptidase [Gemmatimonadaceae bacterium]
MTSLTRPQPGPPRPYRLPSFARCTLPNGLEVIIAPFSRFPVATVRVVVEAGATADARERAGESWLTAKSLAEGTTRFTAEELAVAIEALGGELEPETDWNDVSISTTIRNTAVADALGILGDLVHVPAFPESGVVRNRSEQVAEREQAKRDPREHADEMFARVVYSPRARFSLPEAGEVATIRTFERETAVAFHSARFTPRRTCVIVVGAVDADDTLAQVGASLGDWQAQGAASDNLDIDAASQSAAIHVVDRPGASQTELRVGHVGLPRLHPDYYAVVVMNSVLGGLFSSRINLNLRERHGFTYGAFSAFHWRVQSGPFMISTAVQTDATAAAAREILGEIDRIREEHISEEERSLAGNFLAGVFPIRYETTAAFASGLAAMRVFGLPADYFDTYRDCILGVTTEDVLRVAQTYLQPSKLQIVALGEARVTEPQLAALGREVLRLESQWPNG